MKVTIHRYIIETAYRRVTVTYIFIHICLSKLLVTRYYEEGLWVDPLIISTAQCLCLLRQSNTYFPQSLLRLRLFFMYSGEPTVLWTGGVFAPLASTDLSIFAEKQKYNSP